LKQGCKNKLVFGHFSYNKRPLFFMLNSVTQNFFSHLMTESKSIIKIN